MSRYVFYGWKRILVVAVVLVVLGPAEQAFGTEPESQDVTLSATVRNPAGSTGTFGFTFELEEAPVILHNYSTLPPQSSAIPEASTLLLVGLGALGLVVW